MSEGLRGSCNAMPPEDKPKRPDPDEKWKRDIEERVEALEVILRGLLLEGNVTTLTESRTK